MGEGSRSRSRRVLLRAVGVVVALLLVLAGAAYWLDLGDRLSEPSADPTEDPAAVPPPAGLRLPEPSAARPVAEPMTEGRLNPSAVRRALGRLGQDKRLGPRVSIMVGDLLGRPVYQQGPAAVTPASTLKLLTCLAALEALGTEHRFTTSVVATGRRLTLVGGGDPLLTVRPADPDSYPAQADLTTLARATARALTAQGRTTVRLDYDDSLFSGPSASPFWEPHYLPDQVVSPISALWVDEGREQPGLDVRSGDPAADAANAFAAQLRRRGIVVRGEPTRNQAAAEAAPVASVQSAELVEIVQHVLEVSDNEGAEVLARQVGIAEGSPGSFTAGTAAVKEVAARLGVPLPAAVVRDGSGLARSDRLRPLSLLKVLATAVDPANPELAGVVAGLPVAGFSGSLSYRFTNDADAGLGRVRAKTGTLTGVHGLAGVVAARDGSVMTFVAVADRVRPVRTLFTRNRLDQVAAALAGCRCADAS